MKILKEEDIKPIHLASGDIICLDYTDECGKTTELLKSTVEDSLEVNHVVVFQLDDGEFGFKSGIGGMFVKRQ